jgi:UDP-N-acetylmuramoyl-tripeptide--D-alanyl-D-alanine ligase
MITIPQLYEIFLNNPVITTDSRKIIPGSIFFALKGTNFNGNSFAHSAISEGASYAIIDESQSPGNDQFILVDDVLTTLQQLATWHRKQLGLPIIAITGSNGKTTTKELTASVLKQKFKVDFTQGNLNNNIGVPLTLLTFTSNTEIGVVEMGANHPGEIEFLCNIAQPDFGLITNVGKAHLEGFGSFEGVIRTKSEMYRYLENTSGTIFIHDDNQHLTKVVGNKRKKITYGTQEGSWLKGETIGSSPFLNLRVWFPSGILYFNTRIIGNYNFENILAATAIGKHFGVDPILIKKGIEEYVPSNNRSQFIKAGTNQIIMDAYNANPTSMKASISNFLAIDSPNKVVILGDMLELGEYSESEHQQIVNMLRNEPLIKVIIVGDEFCKVIIPEHFRIFKNVEDIAAFLSLNRVNESLILIKGSRGIGLEKILDVFIN